MRAAWPNGSAPIRRTAATRGSGARCPSRLVADAAAAMARGELDLALVVGGEALATRKPPPRPGMVVPARQRHGRFPITIDRAEAANGIYQAYLTFALLDTARRVHLGRDLAEHREELGRLLAPMTEVAAAQPEHAWFPIARTPPRSSRPTPVQPHGGHPVHQADDGHHGRGHGRRGAGGHRRPRRCARGARRPRVYLRGFGAADEPSAMAARPELWRSPAMEAATPRAPRRHDRRRRRPSRPLLVLRQLPVVRPDALGISDDRARSR